MESVEMKRKHYREIRYQNTHLNSISLKIFWNIDGHRHDENRSQKFANPATRGLRIDRGPVVIGITYSHIAFVRNNYDQENGSC